MTLSFATFIRILYVHAYTSQQTDISIRAMPAEQPSIILLAKNPPEIFFFFYFYLNRIALNALLCTMVLHLDLSVNGIIAAMAIGHIRIAAHLSLMTIIIVQAVYDLFSLLSNSKLCFFRLHRAHSPWTWLCIAHTNKHTSKCNQFGVYTE